MAINVNNIYQTVLLILNKEQRGYMTPLEFNKIATQVQLEIFETYFDSLNQQIRRPQVNTDYASRVASLDSKISIFKRFDNTVYSNGSFSMPVLSTAATQSFQTNGNASYTLTNISADQLAEQVTVTLNDVEVTDYTITNNVLTFNAGSVPAASKLDLPIFSGVSSGGAGAIPANNGFQITLATSSGPFPVSYPIYSSTATNSGNTTVSTVTGPYNAAGVDYNQITFNIAQPAWTVPNRVNIEGTLKVSSTASGFYKLGTVIYSNNALAQQEVERVDRGELFHLNSSNLTKPSTTFPVYVLENSRIIVYPQTITSGISASYIKKPSDVIWNFTVGANGQYIYTGNGSTDFQLQSTEQTELVLKILLYAGVVVKSPEIVQVAAQQVQQENINQQR
jgi:hypothetical protein|tara:strand:+ start:860 stop:2041 length:1182 start_codon:yes stop_codon:yes gene_type:complete